MSRLRAVAGACVALAFAMPSAGCTGGSEPAPTTSSASVTPSPSASASPSPSPTPSVPAAAQAHTKAGAVAFVRFYIDLVNEGAKNPREGLLAPHSDADCVACQNLERSIRAYLDAGHHARSDVLGIEKQVPLGESDGLFRLRVTITDLPTEVIDGKGNLIDRLTRNTSVRLIALSWREQGWVVYGMQ